MLQPLAYFKPLSTSNKESLHYRIIKLFKYNSIVVYYLTALLYRNDVA